MIDLQPAARRTADLIGSLADDQLVRATPCVTLCVGDLVDHLGAFAVAFVGAAHKDGGGSSPPPPADGANLEQGWRERIGRDLAALADAWRDPQAWEGVTVAGGVELPAEVIGVIALDELVVHGWDLAVATGQAYEPEAGDVDAALALVASFDAPRDGELFGPVVPVADGAPPLDRLLGLTGRDPAWRPPG